MKFYLGCPNGDTNLKQWLTDDPKDPAKLRNSVNGFMPRSYVTILEEVEAKDWADLNWFPVYNRPGASTGWLSPEGVWHPCRHKEHIAYADRVLREDIDELEAKGWVHVYGAPGTQDPWLCLTWPTKEQLDWLREAGHDVARYARKAATENL